MLFRSYIFFIFLNQNPNTLNKVTAVLIFSLIVVSSCKDKAAKVNIPDDTYKATQTKAIATMLDSFNIAAANADADRYFNYFTSDAIFIGTDATEHWDKDSFRKWSAPFFEKKRTWKFTALQRHIYFGNHTDIAWFDELLNTSMKICRGSGVLVFHKNQWKVQQYVLSTTVPNEVVDTVVAIKAAREDELIKTLK